MRKTAGSNVDGYNEWRCVWLARWRIHVADGLSPDLGASLASSAPGCANNPALTNQAELERYVKWNELDEEPCSMARTVSVIGDRWTLLVLRECFLRTRRFDVFQHKLGITRHLLSERLKKLVSAGVLKRVPYQEAPKRYEYLLTQKGLDLYPVILSIVHWGDIHMVDERGRPLLHEHHGCGKMFDPVLVCSECGEPLLAREVHTHPGPGRAVVNPAAAKVTSATTRRGKVKTRERSEV